jgi:hypothetical protein
MLKGLKKLFLLLVLYAPTALSLSQDPDPSTTSVLVEKNNTSFFNKNFFSENSRFSSLKTRLELGTQYGETSISDESAQSYLGLEIHYFKTINDLVSVEISPFIFLRSGYVRSDLYEPQNNNGVLALQHAALEINNESHNLSAQIGFIQASRHTSLLLFSKVARAGVLVSGRYPLPFSEKDSFVSLTHQVLVPESFQQNYTFDEDSQVPQAQVSTLKFSVEQPQWSFKSHLAHMETRNLSESIAELSNSLGNRADFNRDTRRAGFFFDFKILEAQGELSYFYSKNNKASLSVTQVYNTQAPAGLNQGFLIEPKIDFSLSSGSQVSLLYGYFSIEPYATIAAFNSTLFDANRVGQMLTATYTTSRAPDQLYPSSTFKLKFLERNAIYIHEFQQHEYFTSLEWESRYDLF